MSDVPDPAPLPLDSPGATPTAGEGNVAVVRSDELLKGRREILISHCQEVYRLRLTRNGKLILTK